MATPVADRVIATDEGRREHTEAVETINVWPAAGVVLYTSGQILREYLVVATRPTDHNGLGMARPDAVGNVRTLRGRLNLLAEDLKVSDRLLQLLDGVDCVGKQVHDANIVATMLVHGIDTVVTINVDDFARFERHVRVVDLSL
jgi:predicted nucleic acid-binding protein